MPLSDAFLVWSWGPSVVSSWHTRAGIVTGPPVAQSGHNTDQGESLVSLLTKETNSYAKFVPWLVDKLPDCSVSNALLKEQNSLTINCSQTNFSLAAKHDSGCLHRG